MRDTKSLNVDYVSSRNSMRASLWIMRCWFQKKSKGGVLLIELGVVAYSKSGTPCARGLLLLYKAGVQARHAHHNGKCCSHACNGSTQYAPGKGM